ncbi:hypothetical protein [Anaerocolumna xylanovorans]|uniref:Zn-finger containing protein n=1 Tax=Anaerocolumna xylanovorans DSM 12503 TaxID=1121345 RepID=A0A1M7Y4B9_9FIRM|nr:hypothetical protein [Anaerocolumna xylanovorans]SHO47077.1 hypothetical protein SAMN02745217_01389 [Anaerocolumna xylanovorans DSM 12503]
MRDKFRQFMVGRYGIDNLGQFMIWAGIIALLLSNVIRSSLLSAISVFILIVCYVRMFSRNVGKRYAENQKFLVIKSRFLGFFKMDKATRERNKKYHIYRCPTCKQKIRVPKGKGKICITCPKCHAEFIRKS